jgi:hypothetical protein
MKLTIFYLTDNSRHYTFKHFVDLLKSSNKKYEWSLLILTHSNDKAFYINELENTNIIFDIFNVPSDDNYMVKVKLAIEYAEKNNTPYLMKCDNDIFITSQTLDYMIDNLSILDNSNHLTLGPTLSSGIPGVEYFIQDYLSADEMSTLENKFLETSFYNRDGAIYDNLNVFTINSSKWDKNSFFEGVKIMNHHYKGIHPIRINYDAIHYLNTCILNNKDKFFKSMPTSLILNDSSPYLCDSIFCIRTDVYKKIIYDSSLFVDAYDEVPLNKYAWNNSMNHVFVKNGFGIHILYNWYSNLSEYETNFCKQLFNDV